MDRLDLLGSVTEYFRSSDHWRRLLTLLQAPDPRNTHIHSYAYTSLHPQSLESILVRYFDIRGWPIVRKINWIRPRPGLGALHGIEPRGKPHFDFHYMYKADVGLGAANGTENGSNLLLWNRFYLEQFYKAFAFRDVGSREEEAIRQYFSSEHWIKGLETITMPNVPHLHINIETSVHPDVISHYALADLPRRGWTVDYVCPNVFLLGTNYRGKLVFMGKQPEKVFDIAWKFNPNVIIEPTRVPWYYPERVGYDIMTSEMVEEELNQHSYVKLTSTEVATVVNATFR